jgi:cytochrome c peroxidase
LRIPSLSLFLSNPNKFDNSYFKNLVSEQWTLKLSKDPAVFVNEKEDLIMLPSDIALMIDPDFCKYVQVYASSQDAWFSDFARAFEKMLELGVKREQPAAQVKK